VHLRILNHPADLRELPPDCIEPLAILPDALIAADAELLRRVVQRRALVITIAGGALSGSPLAAALASDFLALTGGTTLTLGRDPLAWGALAGRIGAGAYRLLLTAAGALGAQEALDRGVADALVAAGENPLEWLERWLDGRSLVALDAAAGLIRRRGGDALERAEFARVFAAGTPQEGLAAFLEKRRPSWNEITNKEQG
jgi:enoyl-CoA hydratase/carnithine racemase